MDCKISKFSIINIFWHQYMIITQNSEHFIQIKIISKNNVFYIMYHNFIFKIFIPSRPSCLNYINLNYWKNIHCNTKFI
jgi:hypothetical protein